MAYLIQRIKEELDKSGFKSRTNDARDWLQSKVASLSPNRAALMQDGNSKDKSMIGRMYFYFYDPKTKDMLPYYDRFPLVIPIERYSDGFLGLNLHYISPRQRFFLLDKLSVFLSNHKYDESTIAWCRDATIPEIQARYNLSPGNAAKMRWYMQQGFKWLPWKGREK